MPLPIKINWLLTIFKIGNSCRGLSGEKKEEANVCLPELSVSGASLEVVFSFSSGPVPTKQYLWYMHFLLSNYDDTLCCSILVGYGDFPTIANL